MDKLVYIWTLTLLWTLQLSGAEALESDIIGITVAACVSFFLLCLVITMIVVSFTWTQWYNSWMRGKNRVRMPKEYFQKKEEARRRLLAESASQSVRSVQSAARQPSVNMNGGQPPHQTVDRASWVQGWNQTAGPRREEETLDATMVLGDEADEEFKIETVLVDNEVLDVGPYSENRPEEKPVKGDVYPVPYIYTSGDKGNNNSNSATTAREMVEVADGDAYATVGDTQGKLNDMVVKL